MNEDMKAKVAAAVAAALKARTEPEPEDEPVLADVSVEQIAAGHNVRRRKDMTWEERTAHDSEKRRRARARQAKKDRRADEQAERDSRQVTRERLREAVEVTAAVAELVEEVGRRRARRVARIMGTTGTDAELAGEDTFLAVNREVAIALDERPREQLLVAARWLADQPGMPDVGGDAPEHAGWLMAVIVNRAKSTVDAWYRRNTHEVEERTEKGQRKRAVPGSLEKLETALANSGGVDTLVARHLADRTPGMLGSRWAGPGQPDPDLMAMTVAGALTARGLDPLVELILEHTRSDGKFPWTEQAQAVFDVCGMGYVWDQWLAEGSRELQAEYAKKLATKQLRWLRILLIYVHDEFTSGRFDPDAKVDATRVRHEQLSYVAVFPDPDAAARALVDALDALALL